MAAKPKLHRKNDFPVDRTREHLEPGPIVLISSAYKGARNIMTLGWHMMLEYSVVGCYVWDANHSFELFRRGKQCVINVPTRELVDTVVGIGNPKLRTRRVQIRRLHGISPRIPGVRTRRRHELVRWRVLRGSILPGAATGEQHQPEAKNPQLHGAQVCQAA